MKRSAIVFAMSLAVTAAMLAQPPAVQQPGTAAASAVAGKPLWPGGAPGALGTADDDIPTLAAYIPASNPTKTAVVIAPGGGYQHLSMVREGSDVAAWLNAHGVAAFVLKYRLGMKYHNPIEMEDAQRAIRTVRAQAADYGIAPDHIGIWGFSAGGHLAATAGTMFGAGPEAKADAIDKESARPDFLILAYPVITFDPQFAHMLSRKNLLGENPDKGLVDWMSAENRVTEATPPTFLYTTTDDKTVPVMNSILFYSALIKNKVSAELHIFEHGPHGSGLAQGFPDLKVWPDLLATWMRANGWMGKAN